MRSADKVQLVMFFTVHRTKNNNLILLYGVNLLVDALLYEVANNSSYEGGVYPSIPLSHCPSVRPSLHLSLPLPALLFVS